MNRLLLCLLLLTSTLVSSEGARILAVLPFFGSSHHRFFHPLLSSLAQAGHHLTVYTPFPLPDPPPNYTQVHLDGSLVDKSELDSLALTLTNEPYWKCLECLMYKVGLNMHEGFFKDPKVKDLLKSNEKFDLIFTESLTSQEFTVIFGHIFKAPVIHLQAYPTNHLVDYISGNALSLSHIPDVCMPYSDHMSSWERMVNSLSTIKGLILYYHHYLPSMDAYMRALFPDMPPLHEMVNNIAFTFTNSHVTVDYPRSLTTNIVHLGGIHIDDNPALPADIKKFMDEATEGVILFSLGTYVPDKLQPGEYFDMFIRIFRKLPQRILWKTMKDDVPRLPNNVKIAEWFPQQGILAHPKCVLFISHCGQLSSLETGYYGIPIIGIPHLFDQHRNARLYQEQGIGIVLDHRKLSEETVSSAIKHVLGNSQFRSNAIRLSRIFKDRPLSPSQSVVYWTEYILRHGAGHLKPASTQLNIFQRALIDVAAAMLVVVAGAAVMIYIVIWKLMQILCGRKKQCNKGHEKKNK